MHSTTGRAGRGMHPGIPWIRHWLSPIGGATACPPRYEPEVYFNLVGTLSVPRVKPCGIAEVSARFSTCQTMSLIKRVTLVQVSDVALAEQCMAAECRRRLYTQLLGQVHLFHKVGYQGPDRRRYRQRQVANCRQQSVGRATIFTVV